MTRIAAIPGSYDPVTMGHVDIVRRAARLFDRVYVVAMENADKRYLLSPQERVALLEEALAGIPNAVVEYDSGLFYEYAQARRVCAIIKGVRSEVDYLYETEIAHFNRGHYPGAETLLMPASPALAHVSSKRVKDMVLGGEDVSGVVTPRCAQLLRSKLV